MTRTSTLTQMWGLNGQNGIKAPAAWDNDTGSPTT